MARGEAEGGPGHGGVEEHRNLGDGACLGESPEGVQDHSGAVDGERRNHHHPSYRNGLTVSSDKQI